ncbi:MAG: Hsp70 family protein, partial [Chloroflexota bacterium]|nr:Hsp70 family protein [Chloroflexota bacterium]
GTFDVSLLELDEGIFEVRAVSGDNWLGGDDYDQVVMNYLMEQYRLTTGAHFPENGTARQRLKEAAEKAKIEVSTRTSATIYLPFVGADPDAPTHLRTTLTRETFQVLSRGLINRMVPPTYQVLADAGLKPEDIDRVVLVGGATRMPAVPALARRIFGKEPRQNLDPDEVVALGAALQAGALLGMGEKTMLLDVLPLSLGIETQGGLFGKLIPRNTPLPASEARLFTTAADGQTSVDINVLQGERALAADNLSLGSFQLLGIPSQARGMAKVEVAFDVDVDGMVHVSATDLHTDNTVGVRLVSSQGLRPEDIQRLIDEARARDAEDGRKREEVEAGIMADSGVKAAELFVKEFDGALGEDAIREVCQAVFKVKEALARGKSLEVKGRCQDLMELLAALHRENRQLSPSGA